MSESEATTAQQLDDSQATEPGLVDTSTNPATEKSGAPETDQDLASAQQAADSSQTTEPAAVDTSTSPATEKSGAPETDQDQAPAQQAGDSKVTDRAEASGATPISTALADDGTSPTSEATNEGPTPAPAAAVDQKVAIITGSNTGIGLVAAGKLLRDGYEVILACRNEEKAKAAVNELKKKAPDAKVSAMKLDLSSLTSVREFAQAFRATGKPLNVLCNNAGLTTGFSIKQKLETEDGFEMTFGVNHLGHFLLTNLLIDELKKTASQCGEARILSTASSLHDPESPGGKKGTPAHLDFDNLMMDKEGTYDGQLAYRNSKLANCAFSVELARRLEGTNVTSNSLCPGFIPATGLGRNETLGTRVRLTLFVPFLKLMGVTRTVEHGGNVIYYVATDPDLKGVTGKHFSDCKETPSSKESMDPDVCKRLWDISADLVNYEQAKSL